MIDFVEGSILPPPPAARVERLQDEFAQRFPPAYLEFLQASNGGKIVRNAVEAGSQPFVIERFLPIVGDIKADPDGWADVAVVVTQLDARLVEDEDKLGVPLVPIASLFAGDFLVLDYRRGATEPSVARWDHEASVDLAPVADEVAPSFAAFLKLLDGPAATVP